MAAFYAAIFAPMAIHLPYFPLWLETRGLTAAQIGIILSVPIFVRVFTAPVVAALADKASERAMVITVVVAGTFAVSLGYFLPLGSLGILAVSIALAVFWAPHAPLSDSIALSGVRRFGASYPRMRIWGSTSFLVASYFGGIALAGFGAEAVPWMISVGLAVALGVSVAVPRLGRPRRPSPLSAAELPAARQVLAHPYFLAMAAGCGLNAASHGFLYAFVSIYWTSLGIDAGTVGGLWALSVVAEVCFFAIFGRLFGHASGGTLLAIASAGAVIRWIATPLIWPLGLGVAGFAAVQCLHALSTALSMLCLQKVIAESIPEEHTGAAQGVAIGINGAGMALVTLGSGALYAAWGANGFYVMALLSAAALGLGIAARHLAPERRLRR